MFPDNGILGPFRIRVFVQQAFGDAPHVLQQLSVAGNVGDLQVECDTALLGSFQVARSPQFQVSFGNLEAIVGLYHDFQPPARIFGELVAGNQYAIGLVGPPSYTPSQLVQLRQAKPFGILDDHHRSVRHIHAHLDDRGRHHDLRLVAKKTLHLFLLLRRFHLAMHLADAAVRKSFTDMQVPFFQVFDVHLFALLNQRIDDVDLPSLLDLRP